MSNPVRWKLDGENCTAYLSKSSDSSNLHGHQHFLITYIVNGCGVQILNEKELPFSAGDMFFLSPLDFHKNTVKKSETFDHFGVKFSFDFLDDKLLELISLRKFPFSVHLSESTQKIVSGLFLQLTEKSSNPNKSKFDILYMQSVVRLFFLLAMNESPEIVVDHNSEFIEKTFKFIYRNLDRTITIADISAYVGYSPNHFNTKFQKETGLPFSSYLRQLRLEYAKKLLHSEKKSITDISLEAGFGTSQLFSRLFRQKYSMSPREYRKSVNKNKADE